MNAASGVVRASGSTSIHIPRGGLPLVTAKWMPASWSACTASMERSESDLSDAHERPVDVGEEEPDHFSDR